jgi:NADPH2:quinone reductase
MALIEAGLLRPTVFDRKYSGLSQVPSAMNDLAARKTWGKCVITLDDDQTRPVL